MNPTVEEGVENGDRASAQVPESNTEENAQTSWSKISSQHEAVLNSHLGMLQSAKDLAFSDGDLSAAMASMLERTNQLVSDFHVLKEQMANKMSGTSSVPQNGKAEDGEPKPTTGSYSFAPKKRPRLSLPQADDTTDGSASENSYSQKRKRLDLIPQSNEDDAQAETPESAQTEDISEEVQRRLEIKEQQRRKRNARPEKRKRDSDSDSPTPNYYYNPPPEDPGRPKKRRRDLRTMSAAEE